MSGTPIVATRAIVQNYRYKPYGAKLSGGTVGLGFFWTGNTGSRSTGLKYAELYNRARHYSSTTRQWITRDPLWPTEHAYGYVRGNPVLYIDYSGMAPPCPPKGWPSWLKHPCEGAKPPKRPKPTPMPWPFDPNGPGKPGRPGGPSIPLLPRPPKLPPIPKYADCVEEILDKCKFLNLLDVGLCISTATLAAKGLPDSVRHCVWGCMLSQNCGCSVAKTANYKEVADEMKGNPPEDSENDLLQNRIGRYLGHTYPNLDCGSMCTAYQGYFQRNF